MLTGASREHETAKERGGGRHRLHKVRLETQEHSMEVELTKKRYSTLRTCAAEIRQKMQTMRTRHLSTRRLRHMLLRTVCILERGNTVLRSTTIATHPHLRVNSAAGWAVSRASFDLQSDQSVLSTLPQPQCC